MSWSPIVILATLGLLVLAVVPFVASGVLEVLLAFSLASLSTALLLQLGVIDGNWALLITLLALLTGVFAVLIWRPMRALLQKAPGNAQVSDLIGVELQLPADFDMAQNPYVQYSGVRWQVRAESAGVVFTPLQRVVISTVEVGALAVRPVDAR